MHALTRTVVLVALLLATGVAAAKRAPTPPPTPSGGARVALAPLTSLTEDGQKELAAVEELVGRSLAGVPRFELVPAADVRKALRKARRAELDVCEGDTHCLAELGRLVGATIVVSGDVSPLAEGSVVYLKAVDVASERELESTTAVLEGAAAARDAEARAAAYRLLAPKAYVGHVLLKVDVPRATVYIDGRKVAWTADKPLSLPVGTHALRVTHEAYRDFVRFVDVTFDETTQIDANLTAFPVVTDEMRQKEGRRRGPTEPRPWYREWWAVAGFGAAVVVTSAIVAYALGGGIDADEEVTIGE